MLGRSRTSLKGKQRQTDTRDSQSGTLEHGSEGLCRRFRNSGGSPSAAPAGHQASTKGPFELSAFTEPRGDTDKEVATDTVLKFSPSSSPGKSSSRRPSKRAGDRQSSSSSTSGTVFAAFTEDRLLSTLSKCSRIYVTDNSDAQLAPHRQRARHRYHRI